MRLDELLDADEWTFALHEWPDGVWRHLAAHVFGGVLWFALGAVLLQLHGWRALLFPGICELLRQEILRERSRRDYPLWAITIDTATTLLTGILLSQIHWRFG